MPAWRILICVYLALGFSLSADAAVSGTATIRIVVSHVPTLVAEPAQHTSQLDAATDACVRASTHAAPHRLYASSQPLEPGHALAPAEFMVAGGVHCLDLATAQGAVHLRIVPE